MGTIDEMLRLYPVTVSPERAREWEEHVQRAVCEAEARGRVEGVWAWRKEYDAECAKHGTHEERIARAEKRGYLTGAREAYEDAAAYCDRVQAGRAPHFAKEFRARIPAAKPVVTAGTVAEAYEDVAGFLGDRGYHALAKDVRARIPAAEPECEQEELLCPVCEYPVSAGGVCTVCYPSPR